MGIIGSSNSTVSDKIDLKSSIIDVGNLVISGMNVQINRQADPMLLV